MLPHDYKLVGPPKRFKNGRGMLALNYAQKYRLLAEGSRRIRSVSLKTKDISVARSRAKETVEQAIQHLRLAQDPKLRAQSLGIKASLREYLDYLRADGNTVRHVDQIENRISLLIKTAALENFGDIDNVGVKRAISKIQSEGQFETTATANKYLQAMQAWTRWMHKNRRWECDVLVTTDPRDRKIKGDMKNSRPRAILTQAEFAKLLRTTKNQPAIRNLSGETRVWLYLLAAQTGLRAQELRSLSPANFHLENSHPFVEISNRISKRGKINGRKDQILINREFAAQLKLWFATIHSDAKLFGESASWWYKGGELVRSDLDAANIPRTRTTPEGDAVIDFHSFRAQFVTSALRTGAPGHVVMAVGRLSDQKLLQRYTKISQDEISRCVDAMPIPRI